MIQTYFSNEFMNDPGTALDTEYLLAGGAGAYSASTVGGCNTRKYHGLFVASQPGIDDGDHVLVSCLDEQVTYKQRVFQLATHYYPGTVYPAGYKLIAEFYGNPVPKWIYSLDDCVLTKEILMPVGEDALLIRYTVADAAEKIRLNLSPFLAFRNTHDLKRADLGVNKKVQPAGNGISATLFAGYEAVYIQISQKSDFLVAPDWYYNIEYPVEQRRGYAYAEDLFVPGHFTTELKKGDKLIVYIGLKECNTKALNVRYAAALKKKPLLNTERDWLTHAAGQFLVAGNDGTKIRAGYYWFGSWGRDTFISLPGLLLTTGRVTEFKEVINSAVADLKHGLLPNIGKGETAKYNSVDAALWFIWAIQQYALFTGNQAAVWPEYGKYLSEILDNYAKGTLFNIRMEGDGLIFAGHEGVALTWMDAVVDGKAVTPRTGKPVEINALWYNAVCFCLEAAGLAGDHAFADKWGEYPAKIRLSFLAAFWDKDKQYLADCVYDGITDWSVRPNQVLALSLPHSPVPEYIRRPVLGKVKDELLTPKGLRTLSPADKNYQGKCEGSQAARDAAYHQGTVWPWILGHFVQAYINEFGSDGLQEVEKMLSDYKALIGYPCLYTIPEIYNGDYPHKAVGAVAQAWSVAELLRVEFLLEKFKENKEVYQTGMV